MSVEFHGVHKIITKMRYFWPPMFWGYHRIYNSGVCLSVCLSILYNFHETGDLDYSIMSYLESYNQEFISRRYNDMFVVMEYNQ